jgi:nanoRNase/pAp phosphatase (c-di-AMP/oligoRNAs hydrolase)
MMQLIDECINHHDADQILELTDVRERVALYREQATLFEAQLQRCTSLRGEVAVVDLRTEDVIHAGNRFMVYALYPTCTVSAHIIWGKQRQNTVIAVGKSIIDRSSPVDIGALMLTYGGGGHHNAGTCQVGHDQADRVVAEVVNQVNAARARAAL